MINLEYIDRIKILAAFLLKIMRAIDAKKINYDMFHLVDIDDKNSYEEYLFVKDAFDVFYKLDINLNDIKLELVKNINRFIFLSEKSFTHCYEHANFEPSGLFITFNMF